MYFVQLLHPPTKCYCKLHSTSMYFAQLVTYSPQYISSHPHLICALHMSVYELYIHYRVCTHRMCVQELYTQGLCTESVYYFLLEYANTFVHIIPDWKYMVYSTLAHSVQCRSAHECTYKSTTMYYTGTVYTYIYIQGLYIYTQVLYMCTGCVGEDSHNVSDIATSCILTATLQFEQTGCKWNRLQQCNSK